MKNMQAVVKLKKLVTFIFFAIIESLREEGEQKWKVAKKYWK